MEQENIIWAVLVVSAIGLIGLGAYVYFAKSVFSQKWMFINDKKSIHPMELHELIHILEKRGSSESAIATIASSYAEYLQKRNDFWTSYGQIILALFIVIVLAILMLTKTISGEAGLPLLSAISGFAIAKGAGNLKGNTPVNPNPNRLQ